MNIQRVKQGARITFYNGIYMVLIGLFTMIFIKLNMTINFSRLPEGWGFFAKYNPEVAHIFFLFNIALGILTIANGIVICYLSDFIIKRKDKMAWVVLFVSGIISWAGLLTISILFRNWTTIVLTFIGWASFVFGMLLPIKYYLEKNYREY